MADTLFPVGLKVADTKPNHVTVMSAAIDQHVGQTVIFTNSEEWIEKKNCSTSYIHPPNYAFAR